MKRIENGRDDRLVFRDAGPFFRAAGWALLPLAVVVAMSMIFAPQGTAAASTTAASGPGRKEIGSATAGIWIAGVMLALASRFLYRTRLTFDRSARQITIRRGVGPLGWTVRWPMGEYDWVSLDRVVVRSDGGDRVAHTVAANGPGGTLTLHVFRNDVLFDSDETVRAFAEEVAAFCGYRAE
jgi:hypothetical protein